MTETRILGYVMARDEWPLLALAITHALKNHVDHVLVVDHASRDGTAAGLADLEREWPGRLTVYRLDDEDFLQEATTAVMARVEGFATFDWVYVFDADEFLLTDTGIGLHTVLRDVPENVDLITYEVQNWVAPDTFDDSDLTRFEEIQDRSRPAVFLYVPGPLAADLVEHGSANFFDLPFRSKAIVRGHKSDWIAAGSHGIQQRAPEREFALPPTRLRAGHVPFLSRSRLAQRCRIGQRLMDSGFPPDHGWQSQMMRRLELAGRLDDFWAAHSVPSGPITTSFPLPELEHDESLANVIAPSVETLTEQSWRNRSPARSAGRTRIPLGVAVHVVHAAQHATREVMAERDEAIAQRRTAQAERDRLRQQREEARVAHDLAVATRDRAVAERDAILASRTWRATSWYRALRQRLRARRQT